MAVNKAVYITRMAVKDDGELVAPAFNDSDDELIRKYRYVGREKVLKGNILYKQSGFGLVG